jgi:hypothetical protein
MRKIRERVQKLRKIPERWGEYAPRDLSYEGAAYVYDELSWAVLPANEGSTVRYVCEKEADDPDALPPHLLVSIIPTEIDLIYKVRVTWVSPTTNEQKLVSNLAEIKVEDFADAQEWLEEQRTAQPVAQIVVGLMDRGYEELAELVTSSVADD